MLIAVVSKIAVVSTIAVVSGGFKNIWSDGSESLGDTPNPLGDTPNPALFRSLKPDS